MSTITRDVWPMFTRIGGEPIVINPNAVSAVMPRSDPDDGTAIRLVGDPFLLLVEESWGEVANSLNYPNTIETEKKP